MSKPFVLLVYDVFKNMSGNERIDYMKILNRINSVYSITIIIDVDDMRLFRYASSKYIIDEGVLIGVSG